jgi:cob(I)alamin adenosyltransferase
MPVDYILTNIRIKFDLIEIMAKFPGDNGKSALIKGKRIAKNSLVFDLLGDLDELNCWLGFAKTYLQGKQKLLIEEIQKDIFVISGQIACSPKKSLKNIVERLDKNLGLYMKKTGKLKSFIVPGKNKKIATLDITRTICRKAERKAVGYKQINKEALIYLNHLSKFLFYFTRVLEK